MNLRQYLNDLGEDFESSFIILEPNYLDEAILGFSNEKGIRLISSYNKIIKAYVDNENFNEEKALDFVEYNTIRALPYMGDNAPIILYDINM